MTRSTGPGSRPASKPEIGQDRMSTHILIDDGMSGIPFSKGLWASEVMVTGLTPYRAYRVAEVVEERLRERGAASATADEVATLTVAAIEEVAGERYAENYRRWREVEALDVPILVLIGGATGVGKSTIATQLAARLGIVRVVATDAIREVLRAVFSRELMPSLHTSSFEAGEVLREPPSRDAVIVGFREQTAAVSVGVNALLDRAATEGTSLIVEGAHIVPGFLDPSAWEDRALVVSAILTVDEEDVHRSHFATRAADHVGRSAGRYLERFENIRRVQRYIKSQALSHGVPVIANFTFDRSLAAVIELVMERATERATGHRARVGSATRGGSR
jgi:2-phosphoglycerate kinase